MVTTENPPDALTILAVAAADGVHPETVRRWVREGKVPAKKVGNMVFIRPGDLEIMRKEAVNG
jgi:excisionase family DNA binding protein